MSETIVCLLNFIPMFLIFLGFWVFYKMGQSSGTTLHSTSLMSLLHSKLDRVEEIQIENQRLLEKLKK